MFKQLIHIFIVMLICLTACKTEQHRSFDTVKDSSLINKGVRLNSTSIFDTTVMLIGINKSNYRSSELNDSLAKTVLYEHFIKRGFWTADNLPNATNMKKENKERLCVEFTSIFKTSLNNNNSSDAVITYWLTPLHAVGNCWQPHKAIILDTDKGYQVSNEEFIPDNYVVDSVKTVNDQVLIYGYEYECARDKILKNLRIRLSK